MATLDRTKLFGRSLSIAIGVPNQPAAVDVSWNSTDSTGLDISGFHCEFDIERSLKPEPATCSLKIYNLAEGTRKQLSGAKKLSLRVEAGYQDQVELLYLGEVRAAWTERQGPDFITTLESGDKEAELATVRLQVPVGAKLPVSSAIQQIAGALGISVGSIPPTLGLTTINGSALTGSAYRRLIDICRSAGLEWSIQNGALQLLNVGQVLSTTQAVLVSSNTGMVDSPTVDNMGVATAKTLIIPGLVPGVLVNFDSLFVHGGYRVERCHWTGSLFGQGWYNSFQARKY